MNPTLWDVKKQISAARFPNASCMITQFRRAFCADWIQHSRPAQDAIPATRQSSLYEYTFIRTGRVFGPCCVSQGIQRRVLKRADEFVHASNDLGSRRANSCGP